MLSIIDPEGTCIDHLICRDKCILRNNHFIKDLRIISNRHLKDLLIIDNSIFAFSNQLENGIYVPSFYGNKNDSMLDSLIPLLKSLATVDNVRTSISKITGIPPLYEEYLHEHSKSN